MDALIEFLRESWKISLGIIIGIVITIVKFKEVMEAEEEKDADDN
jgi:hypothetical protein